MTVEPTNSISPEWGNSNTLRAFPLADDAPAASVIPTWLLADLHITVSAEYGDVFVSSVYLSPTLISVGISAMRDGSAEGILARTVAVDGLKPCTSYPMDSFGNAAGAVAFGEGEPVAFPIKHVFGPEDAPIAEGAIVRMAAPKVSCISDPVFGEKAEGLIDLSGNSEYYTRRDPEIREKVWVHLSEAYRAAVTSVCNSVPSLDSCGDVPVKTINGVEPTPEGNITIRFR